MIYIGIDGIVLRGRDAGTLRYFEELLRALTYVNVQNKYVVFVSSSSLSKVIPSQANFLFHQTAPSRLPLALQQQFYHSWNALGKLVFLHSVAFVPPMWPGCKTIATVPDLVFDLYPQTTKWTGRLWWKLFARKSLQKSSRIITHSHSTKSDLHRYMAS